MMTLPLDLPPFRRGRRSFVNLGGGYCASRVTRPDGELVWRLFWGAVAEGTPAPPLPFNVREGGHQVEFATLEAAAANVAARAPL
jgi:hypothetical protein